MTLSKSGAQTLTIPNILLRIEGLAVFLGAVTLYIHQAGSGLMFALLILAPDLSAIGYMKDTRLGSLTYNTVHTYVLPAILLGLSLVGNAPTGVHIAFIWFAHIGIDRVLGYGLKYPDAFKHTHLNEV
jgi:hypothetical protein